MVPLADLAVMTGGHWTDDGTLVVGTGTPGPVALVRVSADGGAPSPVVQLAPGELFHNHPHVLPGGKAALVAIVADPASLETTRVEIVSFDDGRRQTVVRAATTPRYLPSGHLMYTTRAGILAVRLDAGTGATHGPVVPIAVDAAFDPVTGGAQFGVSRDGTVVYRKNSGRTASAEMLVSWLDATGKQEPLLEKADPYVGKPRLSPDGARVAIAVRDGADQDIWVFDPRSGSKTRLTSGGRTYSAPVWMPDGRHVVLHGKSLDLTWYRQRAPSKIRTGRAAYHVKSSDFRDLERWSAASHGRARTAQDSPRC
ncbi:MAG TPA: hypothetical protein VES67_24630 [Vicinamibacterales bacterium]|nr:hypothetical protein [Vicinamibacterales bacterium]